MLIKKRYINKHRGTEGLLSHHFLSHLPVRVQRAPLPPFPLSTPRQGTEGPLPPSGYRRPPLPPARQGTEAPSTRQGTEGPLSLLPVRVQKAPALTSPSVLFLLVLCLSLHIAKPVI